MKLKMFLISLAILAAGTAQAQILSPTAGAVSGAAAGSQSQAGAISGAGAAAVLIQDVEAPIIPAHTTHIENLRHSGTYTVKSAPNIIAPNILPTVPCASVTSAGLSVLGGGFTFGTAHQDNDCNLRETARLMHTMGLASDAMDVLCASPHAAKAKSCQTRLAAEKAAESEAARLAKQREQENAAAIRQKALDMERRSGEDGRRGSVDKPMPITGGRDLYIKPVMLTAEEEELLKLKPEGK